MAENAVALPTNQPDINVVSRPRKPSALERLGISPGLMDQYSEAQQNASDVNAQATQSLKDTGSAIAKVAAEEIPHPEVPQLDTLPEPPKQEMGDPLRVFGQFLPVLAMIGGAASKYSATAALQAGSAAIKAAHDNDVEAMERGDKEWTQQIEWLKTNNQQKLDQYNAVLQDTKLSYDEKQARLNALAASENNAIRQTQIASGNLTALAQSVQLEANAIKQITEASNAARALGQKDTELALKASGGGAFSLSKLKGPDSKLMTQIQDGSMRSTTLNNLAKDFMALNKDVSTGPGGNFALWNDKVRAMNAIAAKMTTFMRSPGEGSTSDFERKLYTMGAPGADKPGTANQIIARGYDILAQTDLARRTFSERYAMAYGTLGGMEEAFQKTPEFQALRQEGIAVATEAATKESKSDNVRQMQSENRTGGAPAVGAQFDELPDASEFSGASFEDDDGNTYTSDGSTWVMQ